MAELAVRVQYTSKPRSAMLAALRTTFPLWGVVAPIAVVISLIMLCFAANSSSGSEWYGRLIGIILAGTVAPIVGLLTTRWLSVDCITADKNGLQMPFMVGTFRGYLPWESIRHIRMSKPGEGDHRRQSLTYITDKGKKVPIKLSRLNDNEIEQLLLATEMWAPNCEKDGSIAALQASLKKAIPTSESYTDMWEDELRRRFCATAFMPLEPGVHLRGGSLKVIRQLALGGLSALYLCQLQDKQLVVVKEAVVPEDSSDGIRDKAREMFDREATLLMKLNHSNIVKVMDHFVDSGRNYMMLEYVNGQDIRQFVKQHGPQKEHIVLEWAITVANILKHLHEQDPPILHRDLTPDNLVLRSDGQVVLIDFGAANEFIGNATGTFVGKQSFIAPEQFRGKASTSSDIYAFGCTLYFMLTGQEPEALSTSAPKDVNESVSDEMNELVISCTEMEPRDRFSSAAQMLPILRKMAAGSLVS
jgi:tRNA A-37 threonylcarbamoyl transferase component Bud32